MMAGLGWPKELWLHYQRKQESTDLPHVMQRNTPLYVDCCIAAHFGKWPSEFCQIDEEEQELLRFFYSLYLEKQSFAYLDKRARAYWPEEPPSQE